MSERHLRTTVCACIRSASVPCAARWFAVALGLMLLLSGGVLAQAQGVGDATSLHAPLRIEAVVRVASLQRAELEVARARSSAAEHQTRVAGVLDDPMIMPSLDHRPFMMRGADASFAVEQRFPLSGLLGARKRSAQAEARRVSADVRRVGLDVVLEAVRAYWMLYEQRATLEVVVEQLALARTLVGAAVSRYAAGTAIQPDVLRAEIEVARLSGIERALAAEVRAAEAMLNMSMARAADEPVPELAQEPISAEPPPFSALRDQALARRPELLAGQEEVRRAEADVEVMRSMVKPMAFVRTGPAYTMESGWGFMAMVGVSVPIYRQKNRATIEGANNMASMTRADLSAMRNMVQGNVAAAREELIASRTRALVLRDDVLPRSRATVDAVLAAYTSGTVPMVSTLDAARSLWSAQQELVMAEAELGIGWARLARVVGEGAGEQP